MADLSLEFAGIRMKGPIGVAALSPNVPKAMDPRWLADMLIRHVEYGAAYVHTPFCRPERVHPPNKVPTCRVIADRSRRSFLGFYWVSDFSRVEARLDTILKMINILKERVLADVPIIANIVGPGADPEGWAGHAKLFEQAGASLIELDISCPYPAAAARAVEKYDDQMGIEATGLLLGDSPRLTVPIVKEVVDRVQVPVGVKMPPEVGFPRLISYVQQLKQAGARFVTSINGFASVPPPDIYRGGRSPFPFLEASSIAGINGPWLRPICYRNLGTISLFVPGMDQAAAGGLVEHRHVVEAIMLGAKLVELSSGVMINGWRFIKSCNDFLKAFMDDQGYPDIASICGLGVAYLKPADQIDWRLGKVVAQVDERKCNGCQICTENLCCALYMAGDKAKVVEEECCGCNLCVVICPPQAITLVAKG